jgi:hypothetical protein
MTDNCFSFLLNVLDFHIQSQELNKENKVYSNILPFEISFQKRRFPLSGNILQFHVTVDTHCLNITYLEWNVRLANSENQPFASYQAWFTNTGLARHLGGNKNTGFTNTGVILREYCKSWGFLLCTFPHASSFLLILRFKHSLLKFVGMHPKLSSH